MKYFFQRMAFTLSLTTGSLPLSLLFPRSFLSLTAAAAFLLCFLSTFLLPLYKKASISAVM
jgi:hypothetical protein